MKRNKTYFVRTCGKVAEELGMEKREVKIIVRNFFEAIEQALKSYQWVQVEGFFKLKLKQSAWKWAIKKGYVDPTENYKPNSNEEGLAITKN